MVVQCVGVMSVRQVSIVFGVAAVVLLVSWGPRAHTVATQEQPPAEATRPTPTQTLPETKGVTQPKVAPSSAVLSSMASVQFLDERTDRNRANSGTDCGSRLLEAFSVRLETRRMGGDVRISVSSPNTTDIFFTARAVGPQLIGALSEEHGADHVVRWRPATWAAGDYKAEITAAWVRDRFLGQKWELPNRNDNPPFQEKKRKCTALSLRGDGCDRFGVSIWSATIRVGVQQHPESNCDWEGTGHWVPTSSTDPLLDDPVGLNRFNGSAWAWVPTGCGSPYRDRDTVLAALAAAGITRLALFGDSMLVEQFHMLHSFFAPDAPVVQGKFKRLRSMEFKTESLHIKFFRSYTTGGGHSLIASPRTIVEQLSSFKPHTVVGNAAVLHWQQNMRSQKDWEGNLVELSSRFAAVLPGVRAVYVGPTLIQMGRTQGLQPQRTAAFAAAARRLLAGWEFFDPMLLSVARGA